MKSARFFVAVFATVLGYNVSNAQQFVSGFDDLSLDEGSYWIGNVHGANDFESGFAHFSHYFDTSYHSWNGFAYSNVVDTITEGWTNQYAAKPGKGAEETANYGLFYQWGNDSVWFDSIMVISGMYVTNSTLTALSMQNGDDFTKKFGGENGNDPDWFLLKITAFDANLNEAVSIDFYLADYRFENNEEDYIVNDWEWVDLSAFGEITSLKFSLSSSDNGDWGMNTPAYFCLDEIKAEEVTDSKISIEKKPGFKVFPNPFSSVLYVNSGQNERVYITNINGQRLLETDTDNGSNKLDLSYLESGLYFLSLQTEHGIQTKMIVKE